MGKYIDSGPASFKVVLGHTRKDTSWSLRRVPKLAALGLTEDEISELKFNRFRNPRVRWFIRDIKREVKRIQSKYMFESYAEAAEFRKNNYASLVDSGDIYEYDSYVRMGYMEE